MEKCFADWSKDGYNVPQQLMEKEMVILRSFVKDFYAPSSLNPARSRFTPEYVWEECFGVSFQGQFFDALDTLTKKELVYLVLNLENHCLLKVPSIWSLIDN